MRVRRPKEALQIALVCHACGARHHGADRYCAHCGQALFAPDFSGPARHRMANPGARRASGKAKAAITLGLIALAGAAVALDRPGKLTMAGVQLGDNPAQVERILGKPAMPPAPMEWKPGHSAVMWHYDPDRAAGGVPNLSVTFIDGHVRRVAALDRQFATGDGLRVGDSMTKARRLYGTAIEEDPSGDLVPFKFIRGSAVVKVILQEGRPQILAIGIETPDNVTLHELASPPRRSPPGHDDLNPGQGLPYYYDGNGVAL